MVIIVVLIYNINATVNIQVMVLYPGKMCVSLQLLSHVQLFMTPWTVAHQSPLYMEILQEKYWSGLPCPPPGDLPDPGLKPVSLMSPALTSEFFYH